MRRLRERRKIKELRDGVFLLPDGRIEDINKMTLDRDGFLHPPLSPVCSYCARLLDATARRCEAFEYIPYEIWDGKVDHRKPYPGDHGLTFRERKRA